MNRWCHWRPIKWVLLFLPSEKTQFLEVVFLTSINLDDPFSARCLLKKLTCFCLLKSTSTCLIWSTGDSAGVPCAQCLVCFSPRLREQHLCSVPADKEAEPQLAALHPSLHCNGVRDWEQHSGRSSGNKKIPAVPWPLRQHPVLVPSVWAGRDPPVLLQVSLTYPDMHSRKETLVMLEVSFTRITLCNTFHCITNAACSGDCLWVS